MSALHVATRLGFNSTLTWILEKRKKKKKRKQYSSCSVSRGNSGTIGITVETVKERLMGQCFLCKCFAPIHK